MDKESSYQSDNPQLDAIASIQDLCQVSYQRASHLVKAAEGSIEGAVAIHFQEGDTNHNDEDDGNNQETQRESSQEESNHGMAAKTILEIRAICQVSEQRARELWEASSGSVERAINIHFSSASSSSHGKTPAMKRVNKTTPKKKPATTTTTPNNHAGAKKRQSTLDAFVGLPVPQEKGLKQQKMSSFFRATPIQTTTITIDDESSNEKEALPKGGRPKEDETTQQLSRFEQQNSVENEMLPIKQEDHDGDCVTKTEPKTARHGNDLKASPARVLIGKNTMGQSDAPSTPKTNSLPYSLLADRFAIMVETTKRNAKLECLRDVFQGVIEFVGGIHMESERGAHAYLLTCVIDLVLGKLSVTKGTVRNEHITLQVSGSAVSSAVLTVTGASRTQMREAYRRTGDLGDVASIFFVSTSVKSYFQSSKSSNGLSVSDVHELMQRVATVSSGKGSQAARQNFLVRLLRSAKDKNEIRFLVRTLLGNMRLGATLKSVISALATAVGGWKEEPAIDLAETLQATFNICPRILDISKALLEGGVSRASEICTLSVGHPIQPMLANPAHSLEEVDKFMGRDSAFVEWKYDGVRCQAHFDGKDVTLFSRHMINNTTQYPDVVHYFQEAKSADVRSFICDAEIVGATPSSETEDGYQLLPFQDLSTVRGTKSGSNANRVSIRVYSYDLMFLNGESLLKKPLKKRQEMLRKSFSTTAGFGFASSVQLDKFDERALQESLKASVAGGAEGLMIKLRDREYESGLRGRSWLKLKRDYLAGSADTIDVVPIGAWYGNGRKAQAGFLSPVLLAVYDEDEDAYRSISRCMSFTDAMYKATRDFYFDGIPYPPDIGTSNGATEPTDASKVEAENGEVSPDDDEEMGDDTNNGEVDEDRVNCYPSRPSCATYITNENPSIFFKPLEVWEVTFADLTLSRTHTAGAGLVSDPQGRGVAMRFPRFIRRRPDKGVQMATTTTQIAQLFGQQTKIVNKGKS